MAHMFRHGLPMLHLKGAEKLDPVERHTVRPPDTASSKIVQQQHAGRSRALAFIAVKGRATALEIGRAALKGEPWPNSAACGARSNRSA